MADDGTISLAEAFAGAQSELDLGESGEAETPLPGAEAEEGGASEDVEVAGDTTIDGDKGEDGALNLDGLEELFPADGGGDEATLDPSSPEFLDTQVTIDTVAGRETLTIRELQKGYLRQADYTQKTQEVADNRRAAAQAVEFFETFQNDPLEFARTLAVRAKLIEEGAQPINDFEVGKIPTPEEVDKLVEERVAERLKSDPTMQQARLAAARDAVRQEFASIEEAHSVSLSDENRRLVIAEANRRGTTDLGLVFEAMLGRLQAQRPQRNLKKAAPARPSGGAGPADKGSEESIPQSVAEAWEQAQAELSGA